MLDKENIEVYHAQKQLNILPIQRGGGTGPMKPGNQRKHGANTSKVICNDGINGIINLAMDEVFLVLKPVIRDKLGK